MSLSRRRIAVLGAGLQGALIALELARRGARVDLYDRNPAGLAEASAHNEGKIHLGYVYALDRSLATARLMAEGALAFNRLMRRWVGAAMDRVPQSSPFRYVVHRDSLIAPEAFAGYGRAVAAILAERAATGPPISAATPLHRPGASAGPRPAASPVPASPRSSPARRSPSIPRASPRSSATRSQPRPRSPSVPAEW